MQGFKIQVYAPNNKFNTGYLSLTPSTRSTYDIAMRDATIDGLITMDNIENLKPGQLFYKEINPDEVFILQSVNQFEMQYYTRSINAIKQNSFVTVERYEYDEENYKDKYKTIYENIVSFVTMQNKDEKNFQAGVEDGTAISIQIPKRDVDENLYIIRNGDRIRLKNIKGDLERKIKIESIDEFGVPGVIRIYGTYETRTGE
jgi:hypothetical protein